MTSTLVVGLVAVALLVVATAVLAMAETALSQLTRGRAAALADEGTRQGRRLHRLLEHPERPLNAILLLEVLCNVVIASIVALLVVNRASAEWAIVAAVAAEAALLFLLTQALPKTYALLDVQRAAILVAPLAATLSAFWPLRLVARFLVGLSNLILPGDGRKAGPVVTEEELLAVAGEAAQSESIETEERELIASVIEFGDTVVREVMVPRPDMVTVPSESSVREAMDLILEHGYTRMPICGQNVDDVLGVAHLKDVIGVEREGGGGRPVVELARPARFVPETKRVAQLLKAMQSEKFHMAVVVDEYGGTAGLVTLEDLIEELVGEIEDEFDEEEPRLVDLGGGELSVNSRLSIDELAELTGVHLPDGDWDSVGGCLFSLLGHVPAEGEEVQAAAYVLRAERVHGDRIERVRIIPVPGSVRGAHRAAQEPAET